MSRISPFPSGPQRKTGRARGIIEGGVQTALVMLLVSVVMPLVKAVGLVDIFYR